MSKLFVEIFLRSHESLPDESILDIDATDDPIHPQQESRFYHGYYHNWPAAGHAGDLSVSCSPRTPSATLRHARPG
jgi:hypothetical protein